MTNLLDLKAACPGVCNWELDGIHSLLTAHLQAWSMVLVEHLDEEFHHSVLHGIKHGFHVGFDPLVAARGNMPSAHSYPDVTLGYINAEV